MNNQQPFNKRKKIVVKDDFTFRKLSELDIMKDDKLCRKLRAMTLTGDGSIVYANSGMADYLVKICEGRRGGSLIKKDIIILMKETSTEKYVGWCVLMKCKQENAYETNTYITKEFRRKGCGTMLLEHARNYCVKSKKSQPVVLYSFPDNPRENVKFYDNSMAKLSDIVHIRLDVDEYWYSVR